MVRILLFSIALGYSFLAGAVDLPLTKINNFKHEMYIVAYKHDKLDAARDNIMNALVVDVTKLSRLYAVSSDLKGVGLEFDKLQDAIIKSIDAFNSHLPKDQPIDMMFYLFPAKEGMALESMVTAKHVIQGSPIGDIEVKEVQLAAQPLITLPTGEVVQPLGDREYDAYSSITSSIEAYNAEMFKIDKRQEKFGDQPAFLSAVSIQMRLQKNKSAVQVQLLAGLKPGKKEQVQKATEVEISHVVLPEGKASIDTQFSTFPMMLATTEVRQEDEKVNGVVRLKFGSFAGFNTYGDSLYQGPLAIADDLVAIEENRKQLDNLSSIVPSVKSDWVKSCQTRQESTPVLKGRFASRATNTLVDPLLKGKIIDFNIFAIDLLISEQDKVKAQLADIRFSTLGFGCMIMDKVNKQFLEKIDGTIKTQLTRALRVDDLSELIVVSLDDDWDE